MSPLDLGESVLEGLAWLLGAALVLSSAVEAIELVDLMALGRSRGMAAPRLPGTRPFVSLHVPICSEPPEVVARTLIALRELDYDRYEVLVIDNNTADEALWRPVETLCRKLGARFRFHHLACWPGFKAGALNYALKHTAPAAALVAVVDADYVVARSYLADLVGLFTDERVGFVQTPQDYRDWRTSPFATMCYWEYWQFFAVSMALRNRRNAILMHGTMALVRRDVLEGVGGWAEWCLTEDSDLGLRILAAGHQGIYVPQPYGHGLIPFTWRAYQRQRRRWVTGGVQQFARHVGLLLPGRHGAGRLTAAQKLHYLQGWLPWFRDGLVVCAIPVAIALSGTTLLGIANRAAALALAIGLLSTAIHLAVRQFVICRLHLSLSWRETLGAALVVSGLTLTVGTAWLTGWVRPLRVFHRTPKRRCPEQDRTQAARAEFILGVATLLLGLGVTARVGGSGLPVAICLWCCSALLLPAVWSARVASAEMTGPAGDARSSGDAGCGEKPATATASAQRVDPFTSRRPASPADPPSRIPHGPFLR